MKTVGSYEAKTHLPRLLDEVAKGETITITKHGVPVAQLVPPPDAARPDVGAAIVRARFDRDGVDMITDVTTSSVALAVNNV